MEIKKMPEKDPTTYSLITYAWVSVLAAWGGAVRYFRRVKAGDKFSPLEFGMELVTSSFFGIMTFFLCQAADFDNLMTAAFVGMAGHMGSTFMFFISNVIKNKGLNITIKIPEEDNPSKEEDRGN